MFLTFVTPCFIDTATEAHALDFLEIFLVFFYLLIIDVSKFYGLLCCIVNLSKGPEWQSGSSKNIGRKSVSKDRANKINEDFESQGHKAKKWKRINQVEEENNKKKKSSFLWKEEKLQK